MLISQIQSLRSQNTGLICAGVHLFGLMTLTKLNPPYKLTIWSHIHHDTKLVWVQFSNLFMVGFWCGDFDQEAWHTTVTFGWLTCFVLWLNKVLWQLGSWPTIWLTRCRPVVSYLPVQNSSEQFLGIPTMLSQ